MRRESAQRRNDHGKPLRPTRRLCGRPDSRNVGVDGGRMRREIKVTLSKDELAEILARHFDVVGSQTVERPSVTVYAQTDRFDNEIGHTFVFTAETSD